MLLLHNLLRNNVSNQNFFKEGSYIQKLKPFFHLDDEPQSKQPGWSAQKVTNMHLMLQVSISKFKKKTRMYVSTKVLCVLRSSFEMKICSTSVLFL